MLQKTVKIFRKKHKPLEKKLEEHIMFERKLHKKQTVNLKKRFYS